MNRLDHDAQVMTEHLRQGFVDDGRWALAANAPAELRLDHGERRLDIRALVVVREEFVTGEVVQVPHALPNLAALARASGMHFERHLGKCTPLPAITRRFLMLE